MASTEPDPSTESFPLPGDQVSVRKLDGSGVVVVAYDATVEVRVPGGVRLSAHWVRPDLVLPYATFETGARFDEWFYTDRWYNIFAIHDRAGALHGWYCNVAAPATMRDGIIACRDLYLDLWVAPNGGMLVLDEDEFNAASDLDARTRANARAALDELRALVARRLPPFEGLPPGV